MPPKDIRIVAVADFYKRRADQWAARYKCASFQDYRKLLDRKEVDVVTYATPEHWHYLPCIHACQAGKDIYGEQPLSHTIREGQAMVKAVRKYKRVFQTGEQQRSHPATRKAVELIRNGRIGKVHTVIGYNYPSAFECDFPGQPIPAGLDWDRWCGPNEVVPYHTDIYLSRIPYSREEFLIEPAEKYAVGPGLDVVPALLGRRVAQLGLPRTEHGPVGAGDGRHAVRSRFGSIRPRSSRRWSTTTPTCAIAATPRPARRSSTTGMPTAWC